MLCLAYKIVSIEYFMDEMQEYELFDIYNAIEYTNLYTWEQTRWIVYAICQVNSKKKLKQSEIFKLPVDEGYKKETHLTKEITNEEISKLKQMSEEVSKYLK